MRALLSRLFFGDYKFNLEGAPLAHLCFLHHFTDSTAQNAIKPQMTLKCIDL